MNRLYEPEWFVARRRGNKVRWQDRKTAYMAPWEKAPEMGPGSRYEEAKTNLVGLLTR